MKLRDLLDERIVSGVKWTGSAREFVWNKFFPLTPKIVNIINGGKTRIGAFHITGPNMVNNLKAIQGSKKSISCMTVVPFTTRRHLIGIHQNGILYYVEGDIVVHSEEDIMSRPDGEGRRWISFDDIDNNAAYELGNKFEDELYNDKQWINYLRGPEADKNLNKLVARHIDIAEKFATKNKKKIAKAFRGKYGNSPWDEVVLNNIELVDCIYVQNSDFVLKKDEQNIKNSVKGKAIGVDASKGVDKVSSEVDKFIKDRGFGAFLNMNE